MWLLLLPLFINILIDLLHGKSLTVEGGSFPIIWNVPTVMCHKYGYNFSEITSYGIIQNTDDEFLGDRMAILYDPGLFPAILDGKNRNGGIPQRGDQKLHLRKFADSVASAIPQQNFTGLAVIDFEEWRPIFRQNWGSLNIYRDESIEEEKKRHPNWPDSEIRQTAERRFEKAAYQFFEKTLELAKELRPKARWGYYGFPFCFNYTPKNNVKTCSPEVLKDNDRTSWLYESSTALYPSLYIYKNVLTDSKRSKFVEGRMDEAMRIAKKASYTLPVIPYATFRYPDSAAFYSKNDLESSIRIPKKTGASAVILWGSSKFTSSEAKCAKMAEYSRDVIRPVVKREGG